MKVHIDFLCATVQCVHIEPMSKEVSFNTQIFSFAIYYRKEIFVKGRGPVGMRISKEKYWTIKGWGFMWKWKEKYISFHWNVPKNTKFLCILLTVYTVRITTTKVMNSYCRVHLYALVFFKETTCCEFWLNKLKK